MSDDFGVLPTDISGLHMLWERSAERCTLTLHHVEVKPSNDAGIVFTLPSRREGGRREAP